MDRFKKSSFVRFQAWQSIFLFVCLGCGGHFDRDRAASGSVCRLHDLDGIAIGGSRYLRHLADRIHQRLWRQEHQAAHHWQPRREAGQPVTAFGDILRELDSARSPGKPTASARVLQIITRTAW